MPTTPAVFEPSLRSRVAKHVILPLALTWLLGTVLTVAIANYFVQQAFDRSLLDDAYSVAANVKAEPSGLKLALSNREIKHVLFDQSEAVFFAVLRPDGSLVAGHPGLRPKALAGPARHEFADVVFQGQTLRSVVLRNSEEQGFSVVLAQTHSARDQLLQRLLVYSIVPQLLLLALLGLWMRRAIQADLEPLSALQREVDQRPADDFAAFATTTNTREVTHLARALNALLQRIQTGVQAQKEFTGNVAHELRTPLAGIRAQAAYALAQPDPEVWREQLQGVLTSEARASHMVDQLLALALADEAGAGLKMETVSLDQAVRNAVMRCLSKADALGVDLGASGIDQPVLITANPLLLDGILNNLLDNALRYGSIKSTHIAHITVAVNQIIACEKKGFLSPKNGSKMVCLSVTDNGPGMTEEQMQTLTQRWVRGTHSLTPGAGLGLAIVSQYAQCMGAQLLLAAAVMAVPGQAARGLKVSVIFEAPISPIPAESA
jgi:two-component system sensor histidine kinase TctE